MLLRLNLGAHRFQSFSRGIMTVLSIVDSERQSVEPRPQASVPIHVRLFGPGREDWSRGLRELRWTTLRDGWLSRLPDGSIRLHGILAVDLRLEARQVARICEEGLHISASELEIDISAEVFVNALAALPPSGAVLPFVRKSAR